MSKKMKKVVSSIKSRATNTSETAVRIDWNELISGEVKGRWWVVGAPWQQKERKNGKKDDDEDDKSKEAVSKSKKSAVDAANDGLIEEKLMPKLLKLAAKYRMNTDIKRSIFCIIMSGADYIDAFERLIKLNLNSNQSRDIARVLIECSGRETSYNPYYSLLAKEVCSFNPSFKFTFQLAFWDYFKSIDTYSSRNW